MQEVCLFRVDPALLSWALRFQVRSCLYRVILLFPSRLSMSEEIYPDNQREIHPLVLDMVLPLFYSPIRRVIIILVDMFFFVITMARSTCATDPCGSIHTGQSPCRKMSQNRCGGLLSFDCKTVQGLVFFYLP